jgi:nucleoside-diphosphate-sugar epimerase
MKQVILGANGSVGRALAKELAEYSTDITLVSRNPQKVNQTDQLAPLDLSLKANVEKAVEGADIVYVTIGFPYKTSVWKENWLPFMTNVVESCIRHNAKLVFFDNVYAIGGDNVKHITELSPFSPTSQKGVIREKVDQLILKSIDGGKLKAIIARAPDFFGGISSESSIIMQTVCDRLRQGKPAQWFCSVDKLHSYGYVPDLAKGTAILGNTESAYNQIWNLPTDTQTLTGRQWIELFAKVLGCEPRFSVIPNWQIRAWRMTQTVMPSQCKPILQSEGKAR